MSLFKKVNNNSILILKEQKINVIHIAALISEHLSFLKKVFYNPLEK